MERTDVDNNAQVNQIRGEAETYHPFWAVAHRQKKTQYEGDEGTVGFWVYMKALYKDEE